MQDTVTEAKDFNRMETSSTEMSINVLYLYLMPVRVDAYIPNFVFFNGIQHSQKRLIENKYNPLDKQFLASLSHKPII